MLTLAKIYQRLFDHYGPQHWWPADTPFEVMVGAVLTQNTAWENVEKAIANLKRARALSARKICDLPHEALAELLRPSGYFNIKSKRLKNFCTAYLEAGGERSLARLETGALRHWLLAINGVGHETADDILLYAFAREIFVVDAYTRRILTRLGHLEGEEGYETIRHYVERAFARSNGRTEHYNELHALIVIHAKAHCRSRPRCSGCPLARWCPAREEAQAA